MELGRLVGREDNEELGADDGSEEGCKDAVFEGI